MGGDARRRSAQRVGYKRAKIELDAYELLAERDGLKERLEQTENGLRCWIEAAQNLDSKYEAAKGVIAQLTREVDRLTTQLEPALRVCRAIERQLQATVSLEHASHGLTQAIASRHTGADL